MTIVLSTIFIILFSVCSVYSAPTVNTVTPTTTLSDGNTITISGSDFGTTGPNIQMFDNFELGSSGSHISDGTGDSAVIGKWDWNEGDYNNDYPTYSTNYKVSGSQSMRCNHAEAYDCGTDGTSASMVLTKSTDFYLSYWMYIPSGQVIPGTTSCGPSPNLKVWWLSANGGYASDYGLQITSNSNPLDSIALGTIDGGEDRCAGTYGAGSCAGEGYVSAPFYRGRWMRFEFYLHGSTGSDGAVYGWLMDSAQPRYLWQNYPSGDNTLYSADSTGWGYLHFHGYARKDSNSNTYFDDIYVATGPGARARVEIGNNATYSNCTNLAVQTPTSWSGTSITATVRQGSFGSSDSAYLFVVDSDGNVSSGKAITFGSGGGGDTTAPTIDSITQSDPSSTTSKSFTINGTSSDAVGVTEVS